MPGAALDFSCLLDGVFSAFDENTPSSENVNRTGWRSFPARCHVPDGAAVHEDTKIATIWRVCVLHHETLLIFWSAPVTLLVLGLVLFLGVHSVRVVADRWRSATVTRLGDGVKFLSFIVYPRSGA